MHTRLLYVAIVLDVLIIIALGASGWYVLRREDVTDTDTAALRQAVSEATASVTSLREELQRGLTDVEAKNVTLSDVLYAEQKRIDELEKDVKGVDRTVGRLSGSVKTLEKLTTTDPELLQKYSRVYFLNEHYTPGDLSVITEQYDLVNGKEVAVHSEMWPFLENLLEDAWDNGVELMVLSGYRSFKDQTILKEQYTVQYGTGANRFSADQGYSEHQLGTAVDFTTKDVGEYLAGFEGTSAHTWLLENAHKYGFVLSYPENNEFYIYEPWHWRFVGIELAEDLKKDAKSFYDLEQREIDEYIPELFED